MSTEEISPLFTWLFVQRDLDDCLALAKSPILVARKSQLKSFQLFADKSCLIKQYNLLEGKYIYTHTVEALLTSLQIISCCTLIPFVTHTDWWDKYRDTHSSELLPDVHKHLSRRSVQQSYLHSEDFKANDEVREP